MNGLQAQPLNAEGQFNWVFLVEILVCGILSLFFLFYFNRLFATLVSYGIRAYTWHTYRAHIDITSLQISLLGGRIFFKSIQYHAHNITCFVYEGHITWRYWLRQVQDAAVYEEEDAAGNGSGGPRPGTASSAGNSSDLNGEKSRPKNSSDNNDDEEKAGVAPKKKLPCRISVKVAGVEAFIYNRSPLYDGIIDAATRKAKSSANGGDDHDGARKSSSTDFADEKRGKSGGVGPPAEEVDSRSTRISHAPHDEPEIPAFLRIFPIMVECKRAAAAVGNENTLNVLVAKVERAEGIIDAGRAGPLDLYKLLFQFDIQDANVTMKPNRDFKEFQLDAAQRVLRERQQAPPEPTKPIVKVARKAGYSWRRLWPFQSRSGDDRGSIKASSTKSFIGPPGSVARDNVHGQAPWHGLTRYLTDKEVPEAEEWQSVEYAKAITLVECPKVTMRFYWDIPGPVPQGIADSAFLPDSSVPEDMNHTTPPEYGMDLNVHGGFVLYGPWADRQRINLQQLFFPAMFSDAVASKPLRPGDLRVATVFKISVVVEEDVVLRIPSREASKDTRWKGRADKAKPAEKQDVDAGEEHETKHRKSKHRKHHKDQKPPAAVDARPYGWLDITVKKDSVVRYTQDMYARSNGYRNALDIDVKGIEMSSSVNHGLLWRSGSLTLEADLSYPLAWNSLRKWPFKIVCDDVELFILRDHLFLIIDLVNDWASGSPPGFYTFVPFAYQLDMTFRNFCMYLNVNDSNIINDPANFDRNDFLTLEGELHAVLGIPLEHYLPKQSQITFDVIAESLSMRMLSPQTSTFSTFVRDKTVAELPKLTLNGSHCANSDTMTGLTDVLRFNIAANGLNLKAYGFLIRQLVSLKENYFGDYLHFKTLDEFQNASEDLAEANRLTASFPKPKSINELDVILCIVVEDTTIMFPTNMYSADEFVRAEVTRADLDLRVASYYLDMGLNLSPISFLSGTALSGDDVSTLEANSSTQLYISGVDLNGHRMFGLPPDEPAYVSEWDISVGRITGELSSSFVHDLAMAGRAFAFTISDGDNGLPLSTPSVILDATFVQVRTDTLRVWMHAGNEALLLSADPITVESNDWASEMFSQRVSVIVPQITVACVDGRHAARHHLRRQRKERVPTFAFVQTGVSLDVVMRKRHFTQETQKQQAHIQLSSQRTGRATFLRRTHIHAPIKEEDDIEFDPPAMCSPPLPPPVTYSRPTNRRYYSIKSKNSMVGGKGLSRKSSSSSLAASVRAAGRGAPVERREPDDFETRYDSNSDQDGLYASLNPHSQGRNGQHLTSDRFNGGEVGSRRQTSSTMAFSSPYSEPHFLLQTVEPDEANVPPYPDYYIPSESASETSSISETIESPEDDRDREHTTVFIKIIPGIRAYVEPQIGLTIAALLDKLTPKDPTQVLDSFHMDVMGMALGKQADRHGHESIVEIQAHLPAAHVRIALRDDRDVVTDQADLRLRGLDTSVRIRNHPSSSGGTKALALHNALAEMSLCLEHPHDQHTPGPAVRLNFEDVLLWLAIADANSFHLSFRETSVVASGPQARNVCQFVLRLLPVVKDIQEKFSGVMQSQLDRLRLLTYTLTSNGETAGDPPFMTRMVSTLLAFPDHFRNQDSWKILMRFRYILVNLPTLIVDELKAKSDTYHLSCPPDAPQKTLESWTQWYNWDIPYVNQTFAFREIFGTTGDDPVESTSPKPAAVTFRSEVLRVAVETETDVAEVLIEETSLGVENTPPTTPEGLMLVEANTRTNTVVQMHTNAISISLDWGLVDIVENALLMKDKLADVTSSMQSDESRTASQALGDGLSRHDLNVVVSADTAKIVLHSVNLKHVGRSDGLKMSLIGTSRATEELGQCVSAIVTCDTAVTELRGPSQRIWQTLLTSPNLYIDHLRPADGIDVAPTITLAIGYEDIQLAVVEQVPGILHIVDSIISEEVRRVQHLIANIKTDSPSVLPSGSDVENALSANEEPKSLPPKLHVDLLAGQMHFSLSLLQELSYQLEGTAASMRLAPSLTTDGSFTVNFDVGRQNHAFVNTSGKQRHTQGLLQLPPINGNVELGITDTQTSVSVVSTIEKIEVDAAAIQGVIGVINRAEVQDIISAIQTGIEDVQARVEDVMPSEGNQQESQTEVKEQNKALLLDVRFALLGVRVSASTMHKSRRSTTEVEFGIGPVHATASNRASATDVNPLFPEIRATIRDIGAKIFVKDKKGVRPCGHIIAGLMLHFNSTIGENDVVARELKVRNEGIEVDVYPETASTLVDVVNHLQDSIKDLDLSTELEYLRRIRDQRKHKVIRRANAQTDKTPGADGPSFSPEDLLAIKTTIEISNIQVRWLVARSFASKADARVEDLVFSIARVEFKTRGGREARLTIMDLQLQLAERSGGKLNRSLNSALLPEVSFSVSVWSQGENRSFAIKATGQPLDLRLESSFVLPVSAAQKSIEHAIKTFRDGTATWQNTPTSTGAPRVQIVDMKHLASLLIEADFAGATVYMQGSDSRRSGRSHMQGSSPEYRSQHGRYGQFADEGSRMHTTLTSPGIALKVEYNSQGKQPSVNAELRIDASSNKLLPNVVPLVLEVSNGVKEVMQNQSKDTPAVKDELPNDNHAVQRFFEEDSLITANPSAIFGKTKVNIGIRVCKQEFGLTCQPIARVDASASLEDFYFTMNAIDSEDYGHFFAMSAVMTKLTAQVKHMYSREPTFSYDMDSIVLSAMNTKHLSGTAGISAVLNINPTRISINGRQFQDLMLFREIWLPPEIRNAAAAANASDIASATRPEEYLVQRYQTVAAAAAFPWNATVCISKLTVDVDLGQSIGKSSFEIENLWASQQKSSNWVQDLCIGMDSMGMNSTGRMSGFILLEKLGVRTSIKWPQDDVEIDAHKSPLIQASVGFNRLRVKAAYDYQAFAFGDIEGFDFLMYNVRETDGAGDRLVALLDFAKAYVFCTSTSPAQAVGLYQAFDRLIQDKQTAYAQSLRDIEKHLRRESTIVPTRFGPEVTNNSPAKQENVRSTLISLHTDVVVSLGALCFGVYPTTFFDSQMLKLEANTIQARFAVGLERGLITSVLSLTLGQLQVALSATRRVTVKPKTSDVSVDDVIANAVNSKGGTILRVPRVVASMQTWQMPDTNKVEYIFKSLLDGKIDVGWNLSRIDFIKGMWTAHARSLASRIGKSLPESAVKITASSEKTDGSKSDSSSREKITAEINLPQSRYEYTALEPPVIETPQLRDMGEATPPLEWIGLHRDRLPHVTHQIIIVSLLEVCKEVEDAYESILGSS